MKPLVQQKNPLVELHNFGQSVWLDYIRRSLISSGELKRLIEEDGLKGMTSNPAIFEKAIAGSTDYSAEIKQLQSQGKLDSMAIYELLAVKDIQDAADVMRPVYETSKKRDGYVSLEVSPKLANDTQKTIEEAKRLWKLVGRDNLMIKVPATQAGLPVIKELISQGINVNVTLLFSQQVYEQVTLAYISGLEALAEKQEDLSGIASVASFFISRIDTAVDGRIDEELKKTNDARRQAALKGLQGKVAIANGKMTYQAYLRIFNSDRWKKLAAKGAQTQRVLWASTSTKNPAYPDTLYVDQLIGPQTVNTIPPATFDAFRDHGHPSETLTKNVDEAEQVLKTLEEVGISLKQVTEELVVEGVRLFVEPFEKLLSTIDKKRKSDPSSAPAIDRMTCTFPDDVKQPVQAALKQWQNDGNVKRLWAHDSSLWTNDSENKWLGWLGITEEQLGRCAEFQKLAEDMKKAGFKHAMLLGMGGSSLCPEVMKETFGKIAGFPEMHVLDSTDPARIKTLESQIDLANTIFIVSSKSGSTLEPNIFKQYFWQKVKETVGQDKVGQRFIAVTDPGSHLEKLAQQEKFRYIFHGLPSIGGRYSALSDFGMVPSAVMGLDVKRILEKAEEMVHACAAAVPAEQNPGALLGAVMGVLARSGRDKVTLITSPGIRDLGAWMEQLLAESTGKQGKGIIPVDREPLGAPEVYGKDRLFAYLRLDKGFDSKQDEAVERLEKAGQPVVRISVPDIYDLGQEFFRWEFATAVAGSIIGINAFDQPDVEAAKVVARDLTTAYEKSGSLPAETAIFEADGIKLFTDSKNADALHSAAASDKTLSGYLRAHLNRLKAGDYFAVLAYIEMSEANEKILQESRTAVRDKHRVATCLGFGPRFLHSTGQAYKGGPNSGVFLQITCDDAADIAVPGQKYTFGVVKAAQARGDFQVLAERGRRALRVHLGSDLKNGLAKLTQAIRQALS